MKSGVIRKERKYPEKNCKLDIIAKELSEMFKRDSTLPKKMIRELLPILDDEPKTLDIPMPDRLVKISVVSNGIDIYLNNGWQVGLKPENGLVKLKLVGFPVM